MSFIGDFLGDVFGGITGASQAADSAQQASLFQAQFAQAGIDEERRQFDKLVQLMSPYVTAGNRAIGAQGNLIGLGGPQAQQMAINALRAGPEMAAYTQLGENAILQNASATGGLRGGNTQAALAQFRPELLARLIGQQYSRLGGLSTLGQASAAGQAAHGMALGQNIADLFGQQGAAIAGGELAQGGVARQTFGDLLNIASIGIGAKKAGVF